MSGKSKPKTQKSDRKTRNGKTADEDVCDITIDLDLEGVRPQGLNGLSIGHRLSLQREPVGGYESIVCVRADGVKVGAIGNFPKHTALLNCLRRGVSYAVTVTEMRAGGCHVFGGRVA